MVTEISDGIVTAYETFLDDNQKACVTSGDTRHEQLTLTQNRALQMLFDLKFVMKIFPRKEDGQVRHLVMYNVCRFLFMIAVFVCTFEREFSRTSAI